MKPPVFWRVVDGVTWVQVHSIAQRKALEKGAECRRVSYSVNGLWIEVWEVKRTLPWVSLFLKRLWPDAVEVWGSDIQ